MKIDRIKYNLNKEEMDQTDDLQPDMNTSDVDTMETEDMEEALTDALDSTKEENELIEADNELPNLPKNMELNPIDADQAIEIANNVPTNDKLVGNTTLDEINDLKEEIDNNSNHQEEADDVINTLVETTNRESLTSNDLKRMRNILNLTYSKLNIKPITISNESIEENPTEAADVIMSEVDVIQGKANIRTWATVKEDTSSIIQLLDKSIELIESKNADRRAAMENLEYGKLRSNDYNIGKLNSLIGSLRYFIFDNKLDENKGTLCDLIDILKLILDEPSPKLTNDDTAVIAKIFSPNEDGLTAIVQHINNAIATDPINIQLQTRAKVNPNNTDYTLYSKLTGKDKIEVFTNGVRQTIKVESDIDTFNIDTKNTDIELFKDTIYNTLNNFATKFKNIFTLYKTKYEIIEKVFKSLTMEAVNEMDPDKKTKLQEALALVRFYYIEFVSNRITDKVNAYIGLINLSNILFSSTVISNEEIAVLFNKEESKLFMLSLLFDKPNTALLENALSMISNNLVGGMTLKIDSKYYPMFINRPDVFIVNNVINMLKEVKGEDKFIPLDPLQFTKYLPKDKLDNIVSIDMLDRMDGIVCIANYSNFDLENVIQFTLNELDRPDTRVFTKEEILDLVRNIRETHRSLKEYINGYIESERFNDKLLVDNDRIDHIIDIIQGYLFLFTNSIVEQVNNQNKELQCKL